MRRFKPMKVSAFLIVGVALLCGLAYAAPSAKQPKIRGVILDINDARVTNALVKVEAGKIRRVVTSDYEGQFEISLPPGSYQITVEANGFRRFVYSSLKVQTNKTEIINIHLDVAPPRGLVLASSNAGSAEDRS